MDTARCSNNDLGTVLQGLHVVTDTGATNASMAFNAHEIANSNDDLLDLLSQLTSGGQNEGLALLEGRVDLLKNGDGKSGSLASTRLGLRNNIVTCSKLILPAGRKRREDGGVFPYP